MPVLSAIFKGVDEMSSVMDSIADSGAYTIEQWESAGDTISDAFERAATGATETAQATQTASSSTDDFTNSLEAGAQAAGQVSDAFEEMSREAQEAGKKGKEAGDTGKASVDTLSQALATAGIAKMLGEIADAFMDCSYAAMEFEVSMAKVSTLADTTEISLDQIKRSIREVSNDMGISSNMIAEATYQAISGSVDTADAVEFVAQASQLAIGGFTQTTTAVNVLTTAVNAYGLEMDEVESISSMLITTQNLGKTSVDELASSVGKVIPVAAAYNMEMDNLSAAYAELTKGGIETANATTYLRGMLNELGSDSSTVASILEQETGQSFAALMESGYSLADVLEVIGDTVDGDTTAFANLWGSQTAGLGAMALFNTGAEQFNETLGEMQDSSGAVADAYEIMASTTQTAKDRMTAAHENMQQSIGGVFIPVLGQLHDAGANAFIWISDFVDEHPIITAAITGVAIGMGVIAVALVGYTVVVPLATAVTSAFAVAVNAAIWPITLIVAAIAAVVTVAAVLINVLGNMNAEYNALSASSKQQYDQLGELNAEYERAVDLYGETSYEAQQLRWEIEELEQAFESSRMTLEEFVAQNDALIDKHNQLVESYRSSMDQFDQEEKSAMALISKLEELGNASEETAAGKQQMLAIIDKLNEQMPELNLTYENLTGNMDAMIASVRDLAEAEAAEQRVASQYQTYVDLVAERADLAQQLAVAAEQSAAAQERYDDASGWNRLWNVGKVKSDLESFNEEQERLQAALDETDALLAECEQSFEDYAAAAEEAANATVDYETAVDRAIRSVSDDMSALVAAYDEAYEAARTSIDSTIGLFDTMATECEISTNDMLKSWQSQVDYLEIYAENLRKAAEYGLDDGLIASLNDGSEESAGYIDAIISEIERLEEIGEDTAQFVGEFNEAFHEVETAKDEFASTVAEMETNFNDSMDEIQERMEQAIDDMNMEAEAADAAKETIQAYVDTIRSMTDDAHDAAAAVAAATASALAGEGAGVRVAGYASGTSSAERGVKLVGEEGPELVFFEGGETVYTADETARALGTTNHASTRFYMPDNSDQSNAVDQNSNNYNTPRELIIKFGSDGTPIRVNSNFSKEMVFDMMVENMRPILMGVMMQEVFEEGDRDYEF